MVQSCGESGGGRVGSGRALERQVVGKAAPLTDAGACGDGPSSAARRSVAPLAGRMERAHGDGAGDAGGGGQRGPSKQ